MNTLYTTDYDSSLKKVPNICWLPWIGKDYSCSQKKLLVIGLSYKGWGMPKDKMHAAPGDPYGDVREWQADHIRDHTDGKAQDKHHFINAIDGILTGRGKLRSGAILQIPPDEMQELWSKIVLTNFIQNFNDDKSWPEIERSRIVLNDICEVIQPTHICMFAKTHQDLKKWQYVEENKPAILQTPHPTAHGGIHYNRRSKLFQAVIDSWNL